jgi:hypothetical protein
MASGESRVAFKAAPNAYLKTLNWQLEKGLPMKLYCQVCFWGSSNTAYSQCPYRHGPMADIAGYLDFLLAGI